MWNRFTGLRWSHETSKVWGGTKFIKFPTLNQIPDDREVKGAAGSVNEIVSSAPFADLS